MDSSGGYTVNEQVEQLERHIAGYAATRTGRLVALTLSLPASFPVKEIVALLKRRLARDGTPGVDIRTVAGEGPPRMLAAEFER